MKEKQPCDFLDPLVVCENFHFLDLSKKLKNETRKIKKKKNLFIVEHSL